MCVCVCVCVRFFFGSAHKWTFRKKKVRIASQNVVDVSCDPWDSKKKEKDNFLFYGKQRERIPALWREKKRIFREEYTMAAVHCVGDYADLANAGNTNGKHPSRRRRPIVLLFLLSFGFRRRNCIQILHKSDFLGEGGQIT